MRNETRWVRAVALALASILGCVVIAAVVPGPWHGGASHECHLCQLGSQPAPIAPLAPELGPPVPTWRAVPSEAVHSERPARLLGAPPRAPPA